MERKRYWRLGLTAVASVCAILVFNDTFFRGGMLLLFLRKLCRALTPVIYGAAMAYLLAPVVNLFERLVSRSKRVRGPGLMRALSILLAWTIVSSLLYLLLHVLIPQLYASVTMLIGNLNAYYNAVYRWASQMLHDNPDISGQVTAAIQNYYSQLVGWVYNTLIPQAQQALAILTGGIVSVVVFLKNFLVGVIVSIYLLARKESFAASARKLLYSLVSETHYRFTLRAVKKIDKILSGFVRGKLLDSLVIGALCFLATTILEMPYAPLVSVIVGVTNVIPFFGPFLGAIPSAFLILLVSPLQCLYFVILILVLQQFDGNILGPKILGNSTNLPSFWVIVAILIGGGFFGVLGMFLGVPVFACLYTALGWWSKKRLRSKGVVNDDIFASDDPVRIYTPGSLPKKDDAPPQPPEAQ